MESPKSIMTTPPIWERMSLYMTSAEPNIPVSIPKHTKTTVKPMLNRIVRIRSICLYCSLFRKSNETSDARNAGISGNVQGARNIKIPPISAEDATVTDNSGIYDYVPNNALMY